MSNAELWIALACAVMAMGMLYRALDVRLLVLEQRREGIAQAVKMALAEQGGPFSPVSSSRDSSPSEDR